jgi:hypothetical protein
MRFERGPVEGFISTLFHLINYITNGWDNLKTITLAKIVIVFLQDHLA